MISSTSFYPYVRVVLFILLGGASLPCWAQPTGYQKLFLEITDNDDTLDFKSDFKKNKFEQHTTLRYLNYQLKDISKNPTGFAYYPQNDCIHKTLMNNHHHIQIVKNKIDTMTIELVNAFNVYFMSIPFKKGRFKLHVNDGKENQWLVNTLPVKVMKSGVEVYNISPDDWSAFEIKKDKIPEDYFISVQFEKQQLLEKPVLPEDDPNFKNPRRINNLRVEVGDFNFDGQQDYREHKYQNIKQWNYFLYTDTVKGFVLEPLMSTLNITNFDSNKKTFSVEPSKKSKSDVDLLNTYHFVEGKPILLQAKPLVNGGFEIKPPSEIDLSIPSTLTYAKLSFTFVLDKNISGVDLPSLKGFYANKITVLETPTQKTIYTMVAVGNREKETEGCSDSLQIADYNFDGYLDFRICNNSVPNKHTYYLYHPKNNSFIIEKTLSELLGVTINAEQKTLTGTTAKKEMTTYTPVASKYYFTEQLHFQGVALENLTVTTKRYPEAIQHTEKCSYLNQKRIYENDTLGRLLLTKKPLVRKVGSFRFEVTFNPEDRKPSDEKGSYIRMLTITEKERKWGPFEFSGNYFREVPHWMDSLEIGDYNFDGFPDIRVYNSVMNDGRYHYLLYNPEKEAQNFYQETLYSLSPDVEYIPSQKIMKGTIYEANQIVYFFIKNDTLTLTKQDKDLSKPPFIEESLYKYGNRRSIRSAYGSLEPKLKKEFGDYNFDGYEDFRIQSKKSPYMWEVFMYNPKKEAYEKDTLLSRFEQFDYNTHQRTLQGYTRVRSDETTQQWSFYQWSFAEKKMVLYMEKVCFSKFPSSESNRCVISQLVNGKWIETQQFGAE